MEMLLMGACLSLLGVAVTCMAFGAAARPETELPEMEMVAERAPAPAKFFVDDAAAANTRVPIEALLLQIENHVRLEQAAAESFLQTPTSAVLHSRTVSALLN